jgi:hypothetical protein
MGLDHRSGGNGTRASMALPQLAEELKEDRAQWVLEYVTNAINRIRIDAQPR